VGSLAPLAGLQLAAALDPAASRTGRAFDRSPTIVSHATGDLSFTDAGPGETATEDVTVRVSRAGEVGVFAEISGTGLERFVEVRVDRGTVRGDRFRTDGVVYEGPLSGLPRTADTALDAGAGTWRAGETHTFRVVASLADADAAQGLRASADLAWVLSPAG
jgi:hypothetical protein